MPTRCPLSILIPTKNEAANLAACLASARFADEIVVVDSGSTDRTADIARAAGARVINFDWDGCFPKKKNWALANVEWRHEWVFILDADERITPELARELTELLAAPVCDGYYVNRKFWFLDGWLRHSGYYPSWNLRFFKHRLGRYEQFHGVEDTQSGDNEVHEHIQLRGQSGRLCGELEHYAFPTISVWVEKHNRYSNWEAQLLGSAIGSNASAHTVLAPELARKRRLKRFARHLPFRPALRFCYHYLLRAGFLDGYRGYIFCRLMAIYEFLSTAKAQERARTSHPHD
jgi:glycosyltransferase involved in cell wall biosynthesis